MARRNVISNAVRNTLIKGNHVSTSGVLYNGAVSRIGDVYRQNSYVSRKFDVALAEGFNAFITNI